MDECDDYDLFSKRVITGLGNFKISCSHVEYKTALGNECWQNCKVLFPII